MGFRRQAIVADHGRFDNAAARNLLFLSKSGVDMRLSCDRVGDCCFCGMGAMLTLDGFTRRSLFTPKV